MVSRRWRQGDERFSIYLDTLSGVLGRASRMGSMRDCGTGLPASRTRKSVDRQANHPQIVTLQG